MSKNAIFYDGAGKNSFSSKDRYKVKNQLKLATTKEVEELEDECMEEEELDFQNFEKMGSRRR